MTCGGIIFIGAMFAAAFWLSDVVGSIWPVGVAGVFLISFIAWRFVEYNAQRDRIKKLDDYFDAKWREENQSE
jgi:predicted tellurium resistance membrane protein TerC